MKFRRLIFWLHLITGLAAGTVILVMVVTGLMMAFQRQIVAWAERGCVVQAPADAPRLGPETLVAKVQETTPGIRPTSLTFCVDRARPAILSSGRDRTLLINPYTGGIVREGTKLRGFLQQVEHVHRELALGETGRVMTGATSAAFGLLWLSGLCLWWPRSWKKNTLKTGVVFGRGLRGKARDWNWHNVIGFWAALPLLFTILTGLIMSFTWANNLLFRVTGNEPPPLRRREGGAEAAGPGGRSRELKLDGLNELWVRASRQVPDWHTISLRLPTSPDAPVTFIIDRGDGTRPDLRSQLTLNRETGEIEKWEVFDGYNLGRKLRAWTRPVHTGEWGGIIGQLIAALTALAAGMLVYTGFALAWRRFFQRASASARQ